ncbi:Por secretion system protein [Bacteroides sp. 214]|uniref:DUF4961 domain-containing protein n=1 Tax=Bacteroides sp. 214 TaxID=2302935 RepID=UPI0013D625E9|nr:alpha-amylase family glycosyl hydrolase [Bacteroides sp. 214]NDW13280.1 Por secretion system protein [Bacteroides sp. 214]
MKKIIFPFLFILLSALSAVAQIVVVTPEFPTENSAVTIIFDAAQGTAGLKGFSGEVYAHTGVVTNKSATDANWMYAPAWGTNAEKYKLQSLGNDKWQLNITPDIRTYYGVPEGETIEKMAFVFRSADTFKEGKDTGGKDIFVVVYQEGLTLRIDLPAEGTAISIGEVANLKATASQAATLKLFVDEQQVATTTNATEITSTYTFAQAGTYTITAEATADGKTVTATRQVNVLGTTVEAPMPAGVRPGINYQSDTEVTLVLQAPGKKSVYAVGDFNDWQALSDYQLKKDGDCFWITLTALTPGEEYAFQYLVDGNIYIADPYTEKILDPQNDAAIPTSVYPNLKAYPTGKAIGIVSVLQTAQQPYNWQVTDFAAVHKDQLVIYEMLIRDFTTAHSYKAAIDKLDYLQGMGINAIELMPVNEFEANSSWGYNPSFYFAPDKYYGTKNDLKAFIDACHARGMAVILDLVLNHSYGQSPFYLLYKDAAGNPSADNPWYNVQSNIANTGLSWGYDFNHESEYTQALVDSVASFWMGQYNVDGFRYDFTKGFSNTPYTNPSDWASSYDPARIAILKRMASEVWKRNPAAYVIFEHLTAAQEEKELGEEGIMLWRNMNSAYCQTAMGFQADSDFSGVYAGTSMPAGSLIAYMESHDEERTAFKAKTYGDGNLQTYLSQRVNLAKTNAAFFFTVPGPKMIWQFGELAYDYSIDYNGRTGEKPVMWSYYDNSYRKDLYDTYSKLITLRAEHPELFASDANFSWKVGTTNWNAGRFITSTASNKGMVVVGNFTSTAGSYTVTFPNTGVWYNYMTGTSITVETLNQTISVPARSFLLYLNFDPATGIEGDIPQAEGALLYYNRSTERLEIAGDETATIEIYSINGVLLQHVENVSSVGLFALPSGHYLARGHFPDGRVQVCKFVL